MARPRSAASLPAGDVYVKVDPTGAGAPYDLKLDCAATVATGPARAAPGCDAGAGTVNDAVAALGALAMLVLARRRRRA